MDKFQFKQFVCSTSTLMDIATSQLSAISIIDVIRSTSLPFLIPQISLLSIWKNTTKNNNEILEYKYVFKNNETILSEQTIRNTVDNNNNIDRSITSIYNIIIHEEGDFIIEIYYNEKLVYSLSIDSYLIKTK